MTPPTQQELQDALDEFNELLYKNPKFCGPITLKAVQSIRNALKFTMAANDPNEQQCECGGIIIRDGDLPLIGRLRLSIYGWGAYHTFKAMTAKIWEGI